MTDADRTFLHRGYLVVTALAILFASILAVAAEGLDAPAIAADPAPLARIELKPPHMARKPVIPGEIGQSTPTDIALNKLLAEHRCLAEVLYYEARGEGEEGQKAVAEVIFHRLADGDHGHTICSVVYEGVDQTFCQFTFVCDGSLDRPKEPEPWRAAQVLAARLLAVQIPAANETDGATYYHTTSVHPTWAPTLMRVAQIGNHIFYRPAGPKQGLQDANFRGSLR